MSVEDMRGWVQNMYPSSIRWKNMVKNMPDRQVMAIYFRNINKKPKEPEDKEWDPGEKYVQLRMDI